VRRVERWMIRHQRWMYASGRPNRLAAFLNRGWAILASAGLGRDRLVTLEVRGRHSGRPISFPLIVADYDGERYLVAMLGEGAQWVANVRAAGGQAVLLHGRRERVQLAEVAPGDRAPILKRHLQVAPAARSFVPVERHASVAEFDRVAAGFPVFHIQPVTPERATDRMA
jgi:deazaflavin-dependent oxidoreductase (nitroreductase family)